MKTISVKAPAKVNLFLKVLGKRADGYHDIFSWFQAVDLFDYLTIEKSPHIGFQLELANGANIPVDETNIINKIAQLLFKRYNLTGGLSIKLEKNIPVAAGLGGGSSDGVATIYAIDRLFDLGLSSEKMADLGLEIGSDLPFFFTSGQAEVTGRGEITKNIDLPLDYAMILITPQLEISTADSYRNLKMDLTSRKHSIKLLYHRNFSGFAAEILKVGNDFEGALEWAFPELTQIKEALRELGSVVTRLSGSGPTVFGLFDKLPDGEYIERIRQENWHICTVRPITLPVWE